MPCCNVETTVETNVRQPQHFSTGRTPRFAPWWLRTAVRTQGADLPSTHPGMRTSGAYYDGLRALRMREDRA